MKFNRETAVSRKDFDGYFQEYDEQGNEVYREDSSGYWAKITFDENNNKVYWENSNGDWSKGTYDENNNEVYREDSSGDWAKRTYDENNNEVYYETSSGRWIKRTYDKNNNEVYYESSTGFWEKRTYDANNNEVYFENSLGRTDGTKPEETNSKEINVDGLKPWELYLYEISVKYDSDNSELLYHYYRDFFSDEELIYIKFKNFCISDLDELYNIMTLFKERISIAYAHEFNHFVYNHGNDYFDTGMEYADSPLAMLETIKDYMTEQEEKKKSISEKIKEMREMTMAPDFNDWDELEKLVNG